jgi:hypothetical protein
MIINGIDNQTVELAITNYQFPDIIEGGWDGNWLNIYLEVKSKDGHWQTIDPSLTTWEVQWLIDWFNTLAKSTRPESMFSRFTEPNLSFELLSDFDADKKTIRIQFDLESKPHPDVAGKEYFVDVVADSAELKRIAEDLKKELDKYPERKPSQNIDDPQKSPVPREGDAWDPFDPGPGPDTIPKGYKIFPKN